MITKNIRFNSIKEAVDFVNAASRQPYNVDLSRGIYNVDAKSILGVLALGLGNIIRMEIHADEKDYDYLHGASQEFMKYQVEC